MQIADVVSDRELAAERGLRGRRACPHRSHGRVDHVARAAARVHSRSRRRPRVARSST